MGILKITVIDSTGGALADQCVKVSGAGTLQTNTQGMAQFLVNDAVALDIAVAGKSCWSGDSKLLAREEVFQQVAEGFNRVVARQ
jgi:hypothetical protein